MEWDAGIGGGALLNSLGNIVKSNANCKSLQSYAQLLCATSRKIKFPFRPSRALVVTGATASGRTPLRYHRRRGRFTGELTRAAARGRAVYLLLLLRTTPEYLQEADEEFFS